MAAFDSSQDPAAPERPKGIVAVVVLYAVGVVAAFSLAYVIENNPDDAAESWAPYPAEALLLAGGLGAVLAWGLWRGRGWAWTGSIVFHAANLLYSLFTIVMGEPPRPLIVSIGLLVYLTRPKVKAFFGKRSRRPKAGSSYPFR